MKTIQAYKCSYCSKLYQRKHFVIRHEKQCSKNPNNQHVCYDCNNLTVGREQINDETSIKTFFCLSKQIYMHTCKAEARGFSEKLDTVRMPNECDLYETYQPF